MVRKAFTLIELLVVIAIIGILAGIIFPVFARARASAYKSGDLTNLNNLRTALQLYRSDQGAYPPQLLGYASLYYGGTNDGNIIPADQATGFIYPKRVTSTEQLRPSQDRVTNTLYTRAVWPNQDPRPVGTAPILDLNGDGKIDANDDTAGARQAYGPATTVTRVLADSDWQAGKSFGRNENIGNTAIPSGGSATITAQFYNISGFDVATVKLPGGGTRTELRYALFWTVYGLGGGNIQDDPRQLGYAEPPDSTVVTWNSFFRDYDQSGNPIVAKNDQILFLGGGARPVDSALINKYSFRTRDTLRQD